MLPTAQPLRRRLSRLRLSLTPTRIGRCHVAAPRTTSRLRRTREAPRSLAMTAVGIVFGDIGTSPLYAFSVALSATGQALPVAADVLGIVSLIFWALILMVSLKYVVLILRADNEGEGGILALLSLVAGDRVAWSARIPFLVILGVIGAALLYGDGVITPAISVLSAMEGLKLIAPEFEQFTVPVTIMILIGLFLIQRRGTQSIGKLFGPVMLVWFIVIGLLGAANIWAAPDVLKAVNPAEAGRFLAAHPIIAFVVIGGVFLVLTGGEALYADMGHVGARAIRLAWFGLVLPALLLMLLRPGRADALQSQGRRESILSFSTAMGAYPDGGACRDGDRHRVAGADLRSFFADPAGNTTRTVPPRPDCADLKRGSRPNLCAGR